MLLLLLQASASLADPASRDFDLRKTLAPGRCDSSSADIVVCGRSDRSDPYRLPPLPPGDFEPRLPKASINVLGGTLDAHGDTQSFPGGVTSNRAMITLKTPF